MATRIAVPVTVAQSLRSFTIRQEEHTATMAENTPMFEIENLHVNIEDKEILKGVNLTINQGEIHATSFLTGVRSPFRIQSLET